MESAYLLLVFMLHLASVRADPRVTQEALAGPVAAGETVKLRCSLHGANPGTYSVSWVRQAPGRMPQGVLYHATDRKIYRAPGITDRFTPSTQDSSFTYYLTVSRVETADGAVYYCLVWVSGADYTMIHGLTKTSSGTTGPSGGGPLLHHAPPPTGLPVRPTLKVTWTYRGMDTPAAGNHGNQLTFEWPLAPNGWSSFQGKLAAGSINTVTPTCE